MRSEPRPGTRAAALLLIVLAGTSAAPRPRAQRASSTVTVYAAASLTEAFGELGRILERDHPGLAVRFNFAGSQQLAAQLEQGAPADVFASADRRWMDYAKAKGLVAGEAREFARNRLAVIVPRANPAGIGSLRDLARPGTKIVIAASAVPAGRYAREAIRRLAGAPGFPPGWDRRVLANVVSEEENVKGVIAKVQLGEADAGIAYRSDVTARVAGRLRVLDIPDAYNVTASYPIALVSSARNPAGAGQFLDLVLGETGQRVLQQHGFLPARAAIRATPRP